jgi:hypothetical protein
MINLKAAIKEPARSRIMESHSTKINTMGIHSPNGPLKKDISIINKKNSPSTFTDLSILGKRHFLLSSKNMDVG